MISKQIENTFQLQILRGKCTQQEVSDILHENLDLYQTVVQHCSNIPQNVLKKKVYDKVRSFYR